MLQKGTYVSIDWLEFTLYGQSDNSDNIWGRFLQDFPEFDWNMKECALIATFGMGYNHCYAFNSDYFIFYNPELHSNGIHVRIPSHGIYNVAKMFGLDSVNDGYAEGQALIRLFKRKGAKFTRIDLAFDDYNKTFIPRDYFRLWLDNRLVTHGKKVQLIAGSVKKIGAGDTCYIGSRESAKFLRIYDKNAESLGEINAIRYEIEMKRSCADICANKICDLDNACDVFLKTLRSVVEVKEDFIHSSNLDSEATNKSQSPVLKDWLDIFNNLCLANSDVVILETRKSASYYSRMYFLKSLGKTIAIARDVMGDIAFTDWLDKEFIDLHNDVRKKNLLDSMHYDSKFDRSVWDIFNI